MNNVLKILLALGTILLVFAGYIYKFYKNITYSVALKGFDYTQGQNILDLQLLITLKNENLIGLTAKDLKINFYNKKGTKLAETERTTIKLPSGKEKTFEVVINITNSGEVMQLLSNVLTKGEPQVIEYVTYVDILGVNLPLPTSSYKIEKSDIL